MRTDLGAIVVLFCVVYASEYPAKYPAGASATYAETKFPIVDAPDYELVKVLTEAEPKLGNTVLSNTWVWISSNLRPHDYYYSIVFGTEKSGVADVFASLSGTCNDTWPACPWPHEAYTMPSSSIPIAGCDVTKPGDCCQALSSLNCAGVDADTIKGYTEVWSSLYTTAGCKGSWPEGAYCLQSMPIVSNACGDNIVNAGTRSLTFPCFSVFHETMFSRCTTFAATPGGALSQDAPFVSKTLSSALSSEEGNLIYGTHRTWDKVCYPASYYQPEMVTTTSGSASGPSSLFSTIFLFGMVSKVVF